MLKGNFMSLKPSLLTSPVFIAAFVIGLSPLFLRTPVVKAQDPTTGAFTGRVVERETAAPIADAIVAITNIDTGFTSRRKTNIRGEWRQDLLPPAFTILLFQRRAIRAGRHAKSFILHRRIR
jgi:hypothetical protein